MSLRSLYRRFRELIDENRSIILFGEIIENVDENVAMLLYEKAGVLYGDVVETRFRLALSKNII
ncbi:MAG: hypothetical protein GXO26_00835 [Crenarchaeota archaeon]|jgi:hypothetical protein|nr:hypothetical protein [Thermoproteota archaeon]